MPDYRLEIAASAVREYEGLPVQLRARVEETVDGLAMNPRPRGTVKIKGTANLYRIRVGDYRVIYHVYDRERLVDIVHVRHRREAYD